MWTVPPNTSTFQSKTIIFQSKTTIRISLTKKQGQKGNCAATDDSPRRCKVNLPPHSYSSVLRILVLFFSGGAPLTLAVPLPQREKENLAGWHACRAAIPVLWSLPAWRRPEIKHCLAEIAQPGSRRTGR